MSLDCIAIAGRRSTVIFFTVPISLFSQITVNDSGAVSSYGCSSGCTLSDPSRTVDGLQAARLLSQWSKQSLSLGLFSSLSRWTIPALVYTQDTEKSLMEDRLGD